MRLLPRSPRGTWLLAGAVWAVGCACACPLIPYRPRATIPAAMAGYPLENGNGFLLTQDFGTKARPTQFPGSGLNDERRPPADGPFRLWDTKTGRLLGSWACPPDNSPVFVCAVSADGRTGVVGEERPRRGFTTRLRNLATGADATLPMDYDNATFCHDRRHLVLHDVAHGGIAFWDLESNWVVATIPDARFLGQLPDGRLLCSPWADGADPAEVAVREPVTGKELVTIRLTEPTIEVSYAVGGEYLIAESKGGVELFETDTGRRCVRLVIPKDESPAGRHYLVPPRTGRISAITAEAGVTWLERWDLKTGQSLGRTEISNVLPAQSVDLLMPAWGRGVFVVYIDTRPKWWYDLLSKVPVLGRYWQPSDGDMAFIDADTGRERGRLSRRGYADLTSVSSDGTTLLGVTEAGGIEFWDIPPRKPLSWFAAAAGLLALPLAGWAWLRSRRLRRAM